MNSRVKEYDLIRVVSFLFIVIHHSVTEVVAKYGFSDWMSNLFLGGVGVSFFVILSGCSLSLTEKKQNFIIFLLSRASSILPSYWVAYLMVLMYLFTFSHESHMGGDILKVIITIIGLDGYLGSKLNTYYLIGEWFTGFILILYIFSQPAIWLAKINPYILIGLATILSWLSVHFSEEIFNNFLIWNKEPLWNPTSRLMEFSFGIVISTYFLKSTFAMNIATFASIIYLLVASALHVNLLQFSLLGCTFCIAAFIIILRSVMLININVFISNLVNFFSKYSFLAFLFHHQVIMQTLIIIKPDNITSNDIVYIVASTVTISYSLAFIAYKPSIFLRKIVFKRFC
ncbi:acyltransferase family protein [Erwinia billingiae]|uniref:acyltransferase family protein n=1 Tax=Erwinia billingiae TaxID=182337 RepID=UPI0030CC92FB